MQAKQALAILKPKSNDDAGLKIAYREACRKYHPDHNPHGLEMMKLVNLAYETLNKLESWWTQSQAREASRQTPLTETIQNLVDQIAHLGGLKIELIGTWLWVTGNTRPVKDHLKKLGFKFSGKKQAWYFHEGDYRRWHKKVFNLDEIRGMHGARDIDAEEKIKAIN